MALDDLILKAINPKENFLGISWALEVNEISEEAGLKTEKSWFRPCKSIVAVSFLRKKCNAKIGDLWTGKGRTSKGLVRSD